MKLTVSAPDFAPKTFDLESKSLYTELIQSQLELLLTFLNKKCTKDEQALRYDIGVYVHILTGTDPELLALLYAQTKQNLKTDSKREVADHLGWKIVPFVGEATIQ